MIFLFSLVVEITNNDTRYSDPHAAKVESAEDSDSKKKDKKKKKKIRVRSRFNCCHI